MIENPQSNDESPVDGPMLFGRVLDGEGRGRPISWAQAQVWQPGAPGEVLWIHLCRNRPGVSEWLDQGLHVSEPTREWLTSDATRPRALREGGTLVATLRGINFNPGAEPEDMISMQLWCDGTRLVTLRRYPLQTPRVILADIDDGKGPGDAGRLITELTEAMINRMSSAIVDMNDHIDMLEERDGEGDTDATLARISIIRRNCLGLKRHMAPQHEALEAISRTAPPWFEDHDRREMSDSIDRLRRYLDDLDISKESAMVLQDEILQHHGPVRTDQLPAHHRRRGVPAAGIPDRTAGYQCRRDARGEQRRCLLDRGWTMPGHLCDADGAVLEMEVV